MVTEGELKKQFSEIANVATIQLCWEKNKPKRSQIYRDTAKRYALAGLELSGRALYIQALYVRQNLQYWWTGKNCKVVKAIIDKFIKEDK